MRLSGKGKLDRILLSFRDQKLFQRPSGLFLGSKSLPHRERFIADLFQGFPEPGGDKSFRRGRQVRLRKLTQCVRIHHRLRRGSLSHAETEGNRFLSQLTAYRQFSLCLLTRLQSCKVGLIADLGSRTVKVRRLKNHTGIGRINEASAPFRLRMGKQDAAAKNLSLLRLPLDRGRLIHKPGRIIFKCLI